LTGNEIKSESPIYYEGAFDPAFENQYLNHLWLKDNVFWLGYTIESPSRHSITLRNESEFLVKKIEIRTEDLYFVFNLSSKKSMNFPLNWTDNKRTEVYFIVAVTYPDKYKVFNKALTFPRDNQKEYLITILQNEAIIEERNK
jgi:hypothetical protein